MCSEESGVLQRLASVTRSTCGNILRRSLRHKPLAFVPGFGTEINHPIGAFDDIEVVLDHDDRVTRVNEALKDFQEHAHVVEVQAGRRLVEEEERRSLL